MREILFRGKTNEGNWIEGQLLHFKESVGSRELSVIVEGCEWDNSNEWFNLGKRAKVITETVGQYTGLTDKNGKKIFAGDIVDCWSEGVNAKGPVQQRQDGLWIMYPSCQNNIMWGLCPDEHSHTTVEVIGNIHDNPEILKAD